jgi:ribonuclease I
LDIYRKNRLEINKKLNISEAADFTESDVIVSIDSISRFVSDKFKSENTKIGKNDKVGFELDLKRLQELLAC